MDEFIKGRVVMGSGRAANISCEEVQLCTLKVFLTGEPPEDRNYEAVVIAHLLICRTCGEYLKGLVDGRKAGQAEEDGNPG